ncbi:S9 family peptidase [Pelagibius sp. Alg239-R121]|uniref:S9 family peptidase n=1 Tax=Pelagibius sp. Alg239-R121 TaxID=2993448 RepID=UPI0024A74696|nr:S9 family peptidase [Pelagibius sp. Alg239-R121]
MQMPPEAPKHPQTHHLHDRVRKDDYAWMKDPDWQKVMRTPEVLNPEIRSYLEANNTYTNAVLAPQKDLMAALFEEMKGRIKEDDSSVPSPDGPFEYYHRYEEGGQHPVFCRRANDGASKAEEQVVLNGNLLSEGTSFFRIAACRHSPDHRLLAYAVDLSGSEYTTIRIKDLESGELLTDEIGSAQGDLAWSADSSTIFYTILDDNHRPCEVRRHRLGDDPKKDALVYSEEDPGFFVGVGKTESGRFVAISSHDHTTSEIRVIPADAPDALPQVIAPRQSDVEYDVADHGDRFYILTNIDGAEDFKVVTCPISETAPASWQDLIAHEPGRLIKHIRLFANHMVRLETVEGLPRIMITDLKTSEDHAIAFDEEAYDLGVLPGYLFETALLRFTYSSMTTPLRVYDYDMATRKRILRKEQEIPSGHKPEDYLTARITVASHDGTAVPVSLLYRKDLKLDGSAPLLLYGYGSYGHSMPASFSTNRLSLVDRGFVYAIAHIRGGMDKGYHWYSAGKLMTKKNTFLDFVAAAEGLIAAGYTSKGQIAIHGGSAGGMLVGAVANMRPDLLKAVVGEVPFVDVLNTMCDDTLPLTPPEWPEWGNPIADGEAYDYIASYSPYDNVTAQAYPHVLATAGLTDPRVTYWEPAKWVARLRELKTDSNLLLLRTNMDAGHAGASGRFDRLKEVALVYGFLLRVYGLD